MVASPFTLFLNFMKSDGLKSLLFEPSIIPTSVDFPSGISFFSFILCRLAGTLPSKKYSLLPLPAGNLNVFHPESLYNFIIDSSVAILLLLLNVVFIPKTVGLILLISSSRSIVIIASLPLSSKSL